MVDGAKTNEPTDRVDVRVESVQKNADCASASVEGSAYKQKVEKLDLGTHFGVDESLLLDSPPLDTTWRIIVEINASQKPMLVKIPIYDDKIQELIHTCK